MITRLFSPRPRLAAFATLATLTLVPGLAAQHPSAAPTDAQQTATATPAPEAPAKAAPAEQESPLSTLLSQLLSSGMLEGVEVDGLKGEDSEQVLAPLLKLLQDANVEVDPQQVEDATALSNMLGALLKVSQAADDETAATSTAADAIAGNEKKAQAPAARSTRLQPSTGLQPSGGVQGASGLDNPNATAEQSTGMKKHSDAEWRANFPKDEPTTSGEATAGQ